jgi:hypothetical protein
MIGHWGLRSPNWSLKNAVERQILNDKSSIPNDQFSITTNRSPRIDVSSNERPFRGEGRAGLKALIAPSSIGIQPPPFGIVRKSLGLTRRVSAICCL